MPKWGGSKKKGEVDVVVVDVVVCTAMLYAAIKDDESSGTTLSGKSVLGPARE